MTTTILAFAEARDGKLKKAAYEVVTAAAHLAKDLGGEVVAVCISAQPIGGIEALGRYGAKEVIAASGGAFAAPAPDVAAAALAEIAKARSARAVLLPASSTGKDLAPRLSALLDAAQASDCIELRAEGGAIVAKRPVYAGKARWTVRSKSACFLATLRPNVFTAQDAGGAPAAVTAFAPSAPAAPRATLARTIASEGAKKIELTEAEIIVSGGRGMKGPENYKILEELADVLGAAVGASRASVDAGWRPHGDQVGQTGKTVSPNLYIAAGISGAIQHLAGMSSSRVIVAINKDKEAPIFKIANYGLVGDLFEIVPALTAELKKIKQH